MEELTAVNQSGMGLFSMVDDHLSGCLDEFSTLVRRRSRGWSVDPHRHTTHRYSTQPDPITDVESVIFDSSDCLQLTEMDQSIRCKEKKPVMWSCHVMSRQVALVNSAKGVPPQVIDVE